MKNRFISLIILISTAFFFNACGDYLDKEPDDQLDLKTVFENKTNMERWLAYIYNGTTKFYSYDGADAVADELAPSIGWESQGFKAIYYQHGNWTPSQGGVIGYWQNYPKYIRQAYLFIENAHSLPDVSKEEVEMMKAECQFFIAYYHSLLATMYGSVPIIKEAAKTTNAGDLKLKQRPFYEVVDWCSDLFLEAASKLPPSYSEDNKYGRITSLICLAARARLLTFAASPLVNGNPDMAGVVNCDGEKIFAGSFDTERWRLAVDANKELIDAATENGHALYVEMVDGEVDAFQSYSKAIMLKANQGNSEVIFPRTYDDAGYFDRQASPRSMGGAGAIGVTQSLVDAFFMKNGLVPITGYTDNGKTPIINVESGYTETGYSTSNDIRKTTYPYLESGSNELSTTHLITPSNTYNMYVNREPRFYVSVLFNEEYHWGKEHAIGAAQKTTDFFNGGADGGPSSDSPSAGYLIRKRVDPSAIPNKSSGNYLKRQGVLYRLAEAYLSYSESLLELSIANGNYDANKTEIVKYLNMVRRRAGIPTYGSGEGQIAIPSDPVVMRDLIHRERRVELNCEAGIRFDDLRRWKEAETALNGDYYGMNALAKKTDRDAYYVRTKYQTRKFISYWWPIPQDDIDKNTNLRQLPNW